MPAADLRLSPGHSVCIDVLGEMLVRIGDLVNGATIAQESVTEVTYWHVELDDHDIILANGLPAESYIECGNRRFFAGVGGDPDDRTGASTADYCRPLISDPIVVNGLRERLRTRAKALGWTLDDAPDPDLHLVVDGIVVRPGIAGSCARFVVPASSSDVWLASRSFVPHHFDDLPDHRTLGIQVRGITIDDGLAAPSRIDADDPRLCGGFHAPESHDGVGWRWTDGRARLPASLWSGCDGVVFVKIDFDAQALRGWTACTPVAVEPKATPMRLIAVG